MSTRLKNVDEFVTTGGSATVAVADIATTGSANTFSAVNSGTMTYVGDSVTFDLSAGNNFKCAPSADGTITFSNGTAGQSGNILFDNSAGGAHSFAAGVSGNGEFTAGVHWVSYISDGSNVLLSISGAMA